MSRLPLRTPEDAPADARLDAVTRFAKAMIASRGAVSDDDAAAPEGVPGVSLATLCNFANNLGQPGLNPELAAYEWRPAVPAQ